jgi:hypothetical protein
MIAKERRAPGKERPAIQSSRTTVKSSTFYHSYAYFAVRAFVRWLTATAILAFTFYVAWSLAWVIFP